MNKKGVIKDCLNHTNKDLTKITPIDIKNYFDMKIDKKNISFDTKNAYRSYLTSFFDYIQGILLLSNIDFRNPVPNSRVYQFTTKNIDVKKQSEIKNNIFNQNELISILDKSRKINLRDFIIYSILIMDAPRISEVLSIKINDVNLQERYFETGFEKGTRKSTMRSKKSLIFFFTEKFVPFLEQYIKYIPKNTIWLFPGESSFYLYHSFSEYVKRHHDKKYAKFHSFRRTLITNRLKMGCPLWISEGLMNHKSKSVEIENYLKLSIPEKRDLFDKYFPYKNFKYF